MMETMLVVIISIAIATFGAWQAAESRHQKDIQHKRRRTDPTAD